MALAKKRQPKKIAVRPLNDFLSYFYHALLHNLRSARSSSKRPHRGIQFSSLALGGFLGLMAAICSAVLSTSSAKVSAGGTLDFQRAQMGLKGRQTPVASGNSHVNEALGSLKIGLGVTESVTKQCKVIIERVGLFHVLSVEDFEGNRNSVTLDTLVWKETNKDFVTFVNPTVWIFGPKQVWISVHPESPTIAIDEVPCFLNL